MSVGPSPRIKEQLSSDQKLLCPDQDCQLRFPDFDKLYEHYDGLHPLWKFLPGQSKPFKCPFCSKGYRTPRFVRAHLNTHKPKRRGSAVTQDQSTLILQSHVTMADKQRSEARRTAGITSEHHLEQIDKGADQPAQSERNSLLKDEVQTCPIITQQDTSPVSSAQPRGYVGDMKPHLPDSTFICDLPLSPLNNIVFANRNIQSSSTSITSHPQQQSTFQNSEPPSSSPELFTVQNKRRGPQIDAPLAKKAKKASNLKPHKVVLDEMAVTEEGDLADIGLAQTLWPFQAQDWQENGEGWGRGRRGEGGETSIH